MIPQTALDAWRQKAPWPNEVDIVPVVVLALIAFGSQEGSADSDGTWVGTIGTCPWNGPRTSA